MNVSFKGLINNEYCGFINTDSIRQITHGNDNPYYGQYTTDIVFNNGDILEVKGKYDDVIDSISQNEVSRAQYFKYNI